MKMFNRKLFLLLIILALAIKASFDSRVIEYWAVLFSGGVARSASNNNTLLVGKLAKIDGPYEIKLNPPVDLKGKTKREILNLRKRLMLKHSLLVGKNYAPYPAIFGGIQDGAPWWGIYGHFYYGAGKRSIEGPSEESRFIMNPFLLVAVDITGLSIWNGWKWNKKIIDEKTFSNTNFPFYCLPKRLTWWPKEKRAEVTYDLSNYIHDFTLYVTEKLKPGDIGFWLIAYNARDFNLNYMYVDIDKSMHIYQCKHTEKPFYLREFIHLGGSCGYPGDCNNASPYMPEFDHLKISGLPARAHILLWKEEPRNYKAQPDMTFDILFE